MALIVIKYMYVYLSVLLVFDQLNKHLSLSNFTIKVLGEFLHGTIKIVCAKMHTSELY